MLTWNEIMTFSKKGTPAPDRVVEKSEKEWQASLPADVFRITRLHATEPPGSGELCHIHDPGLYHCACCHEPLFDSSIKFESGTGWPSFTAPYKINSIKYILDSSYNMIRIETRCNVCDAHLGHVFPDGPEPSGLRYCINSLALTLQKD